MIYLMYVLARGICCWLLLLFCRVCLCEVAMGAGEAKGVGGEGMPGWVLGGEGKEGNCVNGGRGANWFVGGLGACHEERFVKAPRERNVGGELFMKWRKFPARCQVAVTVEVGGNEELKLPIHCMFERVSGRKEYVSSYWGDVVFMKHPSCIIMQEGGFISSFDA